MRKLLIPLVAAAALIAPSAAQAQGPGAQRAENVTERYIQRNGDLLVRNGETQSVDARCQRDRDRDDRRARERGQRDRDFNCAFRATVEVDRGRPARAAQDPDGDRRRDRDRRDRTFRCVGVTSVELDRGDRPEVELRWSRCERVRR